MSEHDPLPVTRASLLEPPDEDHRWLVDTILPRTGLTICGGHPKSCKSWTGLDLALSVASGSRCFDRFLVHEPGPALIYLAEDPPSVVRDRLDGLCRHRGIDLASIPVDVITAPTLRLDLERDQVRLAKTIERIRPRLLLLDPFVRLHCLRENDSGDVSALLGYLRGLQREYDLALVVVHHARKNSTPGAQNGQGLRGSSDFYAAVDSLLYLRRDRDQLRFSVEHRAAPAPPELTLRLLNGPSGPPHLAIVDGEPAPVRIHQVNGRQLDGAVLRCLDHAIEPLSRSALRATLHCRTDHLDEALKRMVESGVIVVRGDLWTRAPRTSL
jgi:hypothetical protein